MPAAVQFVEIDVPGISGPTDQTPAPSGAPNRASTQRLEYRLIAASDPHAPMIVFLHEGLGSIAMWRDFPDRACAQFNCAGLVYSRYGYGQSTPRPLAQKWQPDYLHHQALHVLPALLSALNIDARRNKPILFGHSDGGTIALLYAAHHREAVAAIMVAAPHIFVEDVTIAGIEQARIAYLDTDLRTRLARYHADVDSAFWAWNDAWLDSRFRGYNIEAEITVIECPVLAMQGVDDEYGTLAQIEGIGRQVPHAQVLPIADCGHSPHKDQPQGVIDAMQTFIATLSQAQSVSPFPLTANSPSRSESTSTSTSTSASASAATSTPSKT